MRNILIIFYLKKFCYVFALAKKIKFVLFPKLTLHFFAWYNILKSPYFFQWVIKLALMAPN